MATANTSRINPAIKISILLISIVAPLTCSAFMGAQFVGSLGTGADGKTLLFASFAILFSSPVMGYLAGRTSGVTSASCCLTWVIILAISTGTSSLSLLDSSGEKISTEISGSNQAISLNNAIVDNQNAIRGIQKSIDNAPENWLSKRAAWASQIQELQASNVQLFAMQNKASKNNSGSTTGQAFDHIGGMIGLTGTQARILIVLLFAVALDLIPFSASSALGSMRRASGKKSPATVTKLHAVA